MALRPLQVVIEQYVNSISYANVASAKLFIAAGRELLVRRPQKTVVDGQVLEFDQKVIAAQVEEAERWVTSMANANASVRFYDQSNIRG